MAPVILIKETDNKETNASHRFIRYTVVLF